MAKAGSIHIIAAGTRVDLSINDFRLGGFDYIKCWDKAKLFNIIKSTQPKIIN